MASYCRPSRDEAKRLSQHLHHVTKIVQLKKNALQALGNEENYIYHIIPQRS